MYSIYGKYEQYLHTIMNTLVDQMNEHSSSFDHINCRIKTDKSMREKCRMRGLEETAENALGVIRDAVGMRVVCLFVDEVYKNVEVIKTLPHITVIEEKDYIAQSKPNGYRSYHMILEVETDFEDVRGNVPGRYFVEVQLRTIAMDTWAQLEHEIKYKHDIANPELLAKELKRCADDLAGCDVSMQTLRNIAMQK